MKSRLIIIILLVFSLNLEAQVRRTTIRAFWQTIRNTIRGESTPEPEKAFYVSSTGSDSNTGTLEEPFQTLDKINSLALNDTLKVYFKRGDSFVGSLTAQSDSIIYDAYGTGDKPKIYGSVPLTGWTQRGGSNIYVKYYPTSDIQQLFVDGVKMQAARLPYYYLITDTTSQTVFTTDLPSQAANYYVGATVILRKQNYFSDTRIVTASTGSTLTIDSSSPTIAPGQSVLLMNKLEFLNSAGEWYYNTTTDSLYFWAAGNVDPDTFTDVRGSTLDAGLTISISSPNFKHYVTVKNIDFLHQKKAGIKITGTASNQYLTIDSCGFYGQDQYGIYSLTSTTSYADWKNNTFSNINGSGIFAANVTASNITNNTFSDIGLMENWGISNVPYATDYGYNNWGIGIDISVGGATPISPNILSYNTFENIGYNGIYWKCEAEIHHNYFKDICLSKSDGGAIYTGSPTAAGSIISYNIIDYVLGNKSGGTMDRNYGVGIYLDENSDGCTVEYNTVNNISDAAIFLHKPSNHIVRYNKTFDARYGFFTSNTGTGTSYVTNNLFITGKATDDYEPRQLVVREADGGTSLNNNTYINGFASDIIFRATDGTYKNFADYKTFSSQDAASSYIGTDLGVNETQRLVYNNTAVTKTFYLNASTSVKDENGTTITSSFTVAPFESKYIRANIDCVLDYQDTVAPTVTAFTIPDSVDNFIIPITTFTATGNVTAYKITESATAPNLIDAGWSSTIPTTYTTSSEGTKTLYAWVRDAAGNISTSATDNIVVTVYFDLLANIVSWHEANSAIGTTLPDSKSGGSDGTLYAGATIDQAGSLGEAILFDGTDDYAYIPRNTSIFAAGMPLDFSILYRFKVLTIDATGRRIFEASNSTTDFFNITNNSSTMIVTMAKNNVRKSFNTPSALSNSTWYTVTATWNATTETFKVYLNGTLITNSTANFGVNGGHASMAIGRRLLETTYTNMLFETVGVFNKVLTQDEINWLQTKEYSDL